MKKFLYILPMMVFAFFAMMTGVFAAPVDNFVLTVKTDNTGASEDYQFTIPTTGTGYDYDVDCNNDGIDEVIHQDVDYTCDYGTGNEGIYTIVIKRHGLNNAGFPRIYFNNDGDKDKILTIEQWGTGKWTTMASAFWGCTNLKMNAIDAPDLTTATSLRRMFNSASSLHQSIGTWNWDTSTITNMEFVFTNATGFNGDVSFWNVNNVTSFWNMFRGTSFNQDISGWNVSNVINFSGMFMNNSVFNQNIGSWNSNNVTNMSYMFYNASAFNQNIGSWDTSNVIDTSYMFRSAFDFNQDIGSWNTSSVTFMRDMFYSASDFNQPLNGWDVSHVTSMRNMFRFTSAFNQPLNDWDVSHVTDMFALFSGSAFNQPLDNWNTESVENMASMFSGASDFNQDISAWNTQNVEPMNYMFANATSFDQNIGAWDVSDVNLTVMGMFNNVTLSTSNYDALLNGWNAQVLPSGLSFNGGNSTYCAVTAHDNMTSAGGHNWTIIDGGINANCPPVITSNGGGSSATVHVNENQTAVTTVTATDPNAGDTVTYGIIGGVDQALFDIDTNTGVLTFQTAPDFENPTDSDTNNTYLVTVTASDGTLSDTQSFTVTVTDVNETTLSDAILSQIGNEADDPNVQNSVVTISQLNDILPVLSNVTSGNETAYQDYIDANPSSFSSPATQAEVQVMVDAVNSIQNALEKIKAYAENSSNPAPTVEDYANVGVTGVDADNLNRVNAEVDAVTENEVDTVIKIQALVTGLLGGSGTPTETPIFRLYNKKTGVHLYTRGEADRDKILAKWSDFEYTDSGPVFYASLEDNNLTPIFRLYNTRTGVHLYTKGVEDRDKVMNKWSDFEFTDGKAAFYASLTDDGTTPIFRLYNTRTGVHLYTRGEADRDKILAKWSDFEYTDGVPAFYAQTN